MICSLARRNCQLQDLTLISDPNFYSKAIPQLTPMAIHKGDSLYFKCPYQAIVIKMFEIVSNTIVRMGLLSEKSVWLMANSKEPMADSRW
jgi:hypothetical protein